MSKKHIDIPSDHLYIDEPGGRLITPDPTHIRGPVLSSIGGSIDASGISKGIVSGTARAVDDVVVHDIAPKLGDIVSKQVFESKAFKDLVDIQILYRKFGFKDLQDLANFLDSFRDTGNIEAWKSEYASNIAKANIILNFRVNVGLFYEEIALPNLSYTTYVARYQRYTKYVLPEHFFNMLVEYVLETNQEDVVL